MSSSVEDLRARIDRAVKFCEERIRYYDVTRNNSRRLYQVLQMSVILLGGLTPILILWTELPKTLQALPAALASILGGITGIFHLQEDWVTSKKTAEDLKEELISFQTRTTEAYRTGLDDSLALENFVNHVVAIDKGQISRWTDIRLPKPVSDNSPNQHNGGA